MRSASPLNPRPVHPEPPPLYDYAFVGSGASATLVLLALERRGLLAGKRVVVLDPDAKQRNDKTFCFWAKPTDPVASACSALVSHRWQSVRMNQQPAEDLLPWTYHHIPSSAVYAELHRVVEAHGIDVVRAPVETLTPGADGVEVGAGEGSVRARTVFDSRPPQFRAPAANQAHLLQSFIGYVVATEAELPAPDCIELMDFSVDQLGATQFVYVLPLGTHRVLVELTRFGETVLTDAEAAPVLDAYIRARFGAYRPQETETGCIPMSTAVLDVPEVDGVVAIGSRAGAVKPSTGYAFKTMFAHAEAIAEGILHARPAELPSTPGRFRLYDRLLLDILRREPHRGRSIFGALFRRNRTADVLRFLDEDTRLAQDLRILFSLPLAPFLGAWMRDAAVRAGGWGVPAAVLAVAGVLTGSGGAVQAGVLGLGLLAVGLPHGALDHLLAHGRLETRVEAGFVARYLGAAFGLLGVWLVAPAVALLVFLLYSAWHFGQADVVQWRVGRRAAVKAWAWGCGLLAILLLGHPGDTRAVIALLGVDVPEVGEATGKAVAWGLAAAAALWGAVERRAAIVLSAATFAVGVGMPLLTAFGLFFIGQHSLHGWAELRRGLGASHAELFVRALPFTAGALALLGMGVAGLQLGWFEAFGQDAVAAFFVFLSCLSLPHVVAMHRFYGRAQRA